jgi:hypothetical protein
MPLDGGLGLTAAARRNPADNRYVDRDYRKLTAEELKAAVQAEEPEKAYLAVAKRIPVQMRLLVDTRRLNRLLAECANEELTVEVRQLRMGCPPSQPVSAFGGGYGASGYGASGYGASGYGASGYGASGYGASGYGAAAGADGAAGGTDAAAAAGAAGSAGYGSTGYGASGYGASGYGASGYGAGGLDAAAMVEVYDPEHAEAPGALAASSSTTAGYGAGYGASGAGYGGYGPSRYGPSGYGASGYGASGYGASGYGGMDSSMDGQPRGRHNMYVEIMGIVYIFNPVNTTVLGVEAGEGGTEEQPASEENGLGDVAAVGTN